MEPGRRRVDGFDRRELRRQRLDVGQGVDPVGGVAVLVLVGEEVDAVQLGPPLLVRGCDVAGHRIDQDEAGVVREPRAGCVVDPVEVADRGGGEAAKIGDRAVGQEADPWQHAVALPQQIGMPEEEKALVLGGRLQHFVDHDLVGFGGG